MKKLLFVAGLSLALLGGGCATDQNGQLDPQSTVYNIGSTAATVLSFADTFGTLHVIPAKVCGPIRAVAIAYQGLEKTVTDPNFVNGDNTQKALIALQNALVSALEAAAQIGFSLLEPREKPKAVFNEPSQQDWDSLNAKISAGINGLNC